MLVMRRGGCGIGLYDATRVDCPGPPVRTYHPQEGVSFFSSAGFSADGRRLAAAGSLGGTYVFDVRAQCDSSASYNIAAASLCVLSLQGFDDMNGKYTPSGGVQVSNADAPTVQLSTQPGGRCEGTGLHWSRTDHSQLAACFETGRVHLWNAGPPAQHGHKADIRVDQPVLWKDMAVPRTSCPAAHIGVRIVTSAPLQSLLSPARCSLTLREPSAAAQIAASPPPSSTIDAQGHSIPRVADATTPVLQQEWPGSDDADTGWRITLSPQRRTAGMPRADGDQSQAVSLALEMPSQHGLLPHTQEASVIAEARALSQPVRCAAL